MAFALHNNRFKMRPFVALVLIFSLIFSMISLVLVKQTEAKTSRLAVIASLGGNVNVKKGGGSKTYDAYVGMSLNQGDTLFTSSGASVILNVSNGDSEITLGEDSEFNISDLAGSGSSKKSKLKMWAGSMWVKVKSLAGFNDQFEVETPTAVMGVRGTQFFVGVDPESGKSKLAVGAGVVAATVTSPGEQGTKTASVFGIAPPPPENEKTEALVYPTQQLTVESRKESKNLAVKIEPLDIEAIVKSASANVIQAIIENKATIDKENAQFIDKKKQEIASGTNAAGKNSTFVVKNNEELNKVIVNLNNLVGNIAKNAVDTHKVDKATIDKAIETANKDIVDPNQKLDLNNVKPFDKTAGVDADAEKLRLEQQKILESVKELKLQEEKKKQDELKAALSEVLKALENTRKALQEANLKAKEEAKARAESELLKNLSPSEKDKFKQNQVNNGPSPAVINTPTAPNTPNTSTSSTEPDLTPKVIITPTRDSVGGNVKFLISLNDFVNLYGAELHFVYDNNISYDYEHPVHFPENSVFKPFVSVDDHSVFNVNEFPGVTKKELVFVITKYGKETLSLSVSGSGQPLVELQFWVRGPGTISIPTDGVIMVNKAGNIIAPTIQGQTSYTVN